MLCFLFLIRLFQSDRFQVGFTSDWGTLRQRIKEARTWGSRSRNREELALS